MAFERKEGFLPLWFLGEGKSWSQSLCDGYSGDDE